VLQPGDPDSYYRSREIVPEDMLPDLGKAKIVITNYHAFKKKTKFRSTRCSGRPCAPIPGRKAMAR
jgi:type III restriction enzyme